MLNENHIREVAERHTCEHKGLIYRVALSRTRFDPPTETGIQPRAVDLDFTATPLAGGNLMRLSLHLSIDSAADDVFLLEAIDDTIRKIVDGDLPPGTSELL